MSSITPRISIITITFNSEKTIEETILSVISQDYDHLEYIIIDGNSRDRTLEIVEKYRNMISIVVSEPDGGISDAFNKGIKLATGEIIGIINSDDLLLPGALQIISSSYDCTIDVYRGNTIVWDDNTGIKFRSVPSMEFSAKGLKKRSVCHQSTFITKKAYERWGCYDVNLRFMMDADLLIRLYEGGARWKYVNADLAVSRSGGVTDQNGFWKKRNESFAIVKNNGGGSLFASIHMFWFLIRQSAKHFLSTLWGKDRIKKIKHHKSFMTTM